MKTKLRPTSAAVLLLKLRSRNRPWSGPASQPGNVWTLRATSAVGPDVVNATHEQRAEHERAEGGASGERVQRPPGASAGATARRA